MTTPDHERVLELLSETLTPRLGGAPPLTLLRESTRRRSDLWFVGLRGERGCRWVVKRPRTDSEQGDLASPLSSEGQAAALARLAGHFASGGVRLRTPEVVALLPEIDAFAMEFVAGPHLADLIRPTALVAPTRLLVAVADAADALRVIHRLEPPTSAAEVLLHGDYAPENVLLPGLQVYCLDPELTTRGDPDSDVVRFLTMLFDAPMFVVGARIGAVRRLRRRAAAAFVSTYYAGGEVSAALPWLLAESLEARWATRHKDCVRRRPPLAGARIRLLRSSFTSLLEEVDEGRTFAGR